MAKVVVIDMGMGNIRSLVSALSFLGVDHLVSESADSLDDSTHIILPGVGAYDAAMGKLGDLSMIDPIRTHVLKRCKPILGICLGMQLMCSSSEEGQLPGLELVGGRFVRLKPNLKCEYKVPHVGFSEVRGYEPKGLFEGLGETSFFYFTHSFALAETQDAQFNSGYCEHTREFVAAFQHDVISAVQFHPEKSQSSGLRVLHNFLANV